MSNRRPNQNLADYGWKIGDVLMVVKTQSLMSVASPKTVWFNGEEMNLTAVAKHLGLPRCDGIMNIRTGELSTDLYAQLHAVS